MQGGRPKGLYFCPSWSTDKYMQGVREPDCYPDQSGEYQQLLNSMQELYAHYGMVFHMNPNTYGRDHCENAQRNGLGAQNAPSFYFGGSFISRTNPANNVVVYLPSVRRPAETALIGDGITAFSPPYVWISIGCETRYMHQDGSNFTFLDGHSKNIRRNSERYLLQTQCPQGQIWVMRYYTYTAE